MKSYAECCKIVAQKHGLINPSGKGAKTLVTGHMAKYFEEAAMMYVEEIKKQKEEIFEKLLQLEKDKTYYLGK